MKFSAKLFRLRRPSGAPRRVVRFVDALARRHVGLEPSSRPSVPLPLLGRASCGGFVASVTTRRVYIHARRSRVACTAAPRGGRTCRGDAKEARFHVHFRRLDFARCVESSGHWSVDLCEEVWGWPELSREKKKLRIKDCKGGQDGSRLATNFIEKTNVARAHKAAAAETSRISRCWTKHKSYAEARNESPAS